MIVEFLHLFLYILQYGASQWTQVKKCKIRASENISPIIARENEKLFRVNERNNLMNANS